MTCCMNEQGLTLLSSPPCSPGLAGVSGRCIFLLVSLQEAKLRVAELQWKSPHENLKCSKNLCLIIVAQTHAKLLAPYPQHIAILKSIWINDVACLISEA